MLTVDSTWAKDYCAEAISFWKFPMRVDKYLTENRVPKES